MDQRNIDLREWDVKFNLQNLPTHSQNQSIKIHRKFVPLSSKYEECRGCSLSLYIRKYGDLWEKLSPK